MRTALRRANHKIIEDGHAHGHAVGHLFEHGPLRAIGHCGSDFGATIHRARMQDQCVGPREPQAFGP